MRADSEDAVISPALVEEDWIKADTQFATVQPGLVGWIKADSKIAVVNPSGVPVCVPGETKCEGYDLYTCSLAGQWKLTERNATACGYVPPEEEKKPFPWLWVGVGVAGASLVGLVVAEKEPE